MFFQFGVNHNTYFVVMFGFSCTGKRIEICFWGGIVCPKRKNPKKKEKRERGRKSLQELRKKTKNSWIYSSTDSP